MTYLYTETFLKIICVSLKNGKSAIVRTFFAVGKQLDLAMFEEIAVNPHSSLY